jgi:histidyl-tRNA synthetase
MKIPAVKGTRDFYPQQMARRNWIIDGWKKASIRNGFVEYDGPILEYLKMFQIKSGDEIAGQLFSLQDRGGRELAIRPEITPTLARMISQRINTLPRPIKWFSVPRLCRAERPQRGRLREFFQWNIDIIGEKSILADAEVIFTTVDYLRSVRLSHRDVKVRISSRKFLASALRNIGIPENQLGSLYTLLDKYRKIPLNTFEKMLTEQVPDSAMSKKIVDLMNATALREVTDDIVGTNKELEEAIQELAHLHNLLNQMDVWQYCDFCPSVVRGLAYYTGIVFEVHEIGGNLRAIAGGGRYDNLLHDFGGPDIPAVGMGMGDCVLEILLEEKGLFDKQVPVNSLDYFVVCAGVVTRTDERGVVLSTGEEEVVKLVAKLRQKGYSADFSYNFSSLSDQIRVAAARNARKCIIIGQELFEENKLVVKDMSSREQELIDADKFLEQL